jgi:predicted lipid-binding transport protein (Tim44 family)
MDFLESIIPGVACAIFILLAFIIAIIPYLLVGFLIFIVIRFFWRMSKREQVADLAKARQRTQMYLEREQALKNYYQYARQQGLSRSEVIERLINQGDWSQTEIKSVLNKLP